MPTPRTARPAAEDAPESLAGTRYEVEIGPVAHGGHCVARHEGRVLFVR
ncbi:MAG: TRAM domain-containing protein, partial [Streptomycetaceae bacterium]|nr:TRAM domain-containing protein [Streptomycetaceae bacterium]